MSVEGLVQHLEKVFAEREAVRALFLGGSYGNGMADDFSDLDFILLAEASSFAALEKEWRSALEAFAAVVFWNRRASDDGLLLNAITESWLRCDVYMSAPSGFGQKAKNQLRPIIDRDDIHMRLPEALPPRAPDPQRVAYIVKEFIRVLGLMHVGLGRKEYFLLADKGVGLLRDLLTNLLLEEVTLPDRGGMLHLSRLLPAEDMRMLETLSFPPPERQALITAHLELARRFFPRARRLSDALGLEWPEAFERATRNSLQKTLGFSRDKLW